MLILILSKLINCTYESENMKHAFTYLISTKIGRHFKVLSFNSKENKPNIIYFLDKLYSFTGSIQLLLWKHALVCRREFQPCRKSANHNLERSLFRRTLKTTSGPVWSTFTFLGFKILKNSTLVGRMTFFHFGNCVALAYVPYVIIYRCSGL